MAEEAEVVRFQARLNSFPDGATGTMVGILREKLRNAEIMLSKTVEAAMVAAPEPGQKRQEAYYCNDEGCWVAQQYFCDETGCWITEAPAQALERTFNGDSAPQAIGSGAPAPQKAIVQE